MLWDTHIHTDFSGDSDASPDSMIEQAIRMNLPGICITDHLDYDYPNEPELFLLPLNDYATGIRQYQSRYDHRLPVLYGIELGVQPHLAKKHKDIISAYPFDFVIASSHTAEGMDPYYEEYFAQISQENAYCRYFSSILENISCFDDFDVYGHLDYVTRYGNPPVPAYTYPSCKKLIDEILSELIRLGKGIELNTGGFRSSTGKENPHKDILLRYHQLGGTVITLGSDAHAPEHIAWEFEKARQLLLSCGFTRYCFFKNREPHFLSL